ncbi:hypothetical protein D9M71_762950 [compost metagenome]
MQIRRVAKIEQIIHDQAVIQLHREGRRWRKDVSLHVIEPREIGDLRRISCRCFAHPNPDQGVLLYDWEATNFCSLRNRTVAVRIEYATATAVEMKAVVAAFNRVADQLPFIQRGETVRAHIA